MDCAPGTDKIGDYDGYDNNQVVKIRLCALPILSSSEESHGGYGIPASKTKGRALVNSRASGAWYALVRKAEEDGVKMAATSSFRTMAHQQTLWNGHPDTKWVARPGYSNHQMGLAIDFSPPGGGFLTKGDKWYNWLSANAEKYDIKNYPVEAWHWSPTGN